MIKAYDDNGNVIKCAKCKYYDRHNLICNNDKNCYRGSGNEYGFSLDFIAIDKPLLPTETCDNWFCADFELKEHNEQNSIIEALKPRGCADMPKKIICNCTKELTYREIFEHFLENCETKSPIEDYRPCIPMYGVPDIPYAIVIWLADGTKIIYIDK